MGDIIETQAQTPDSCLVTSKKWLNMVLTGFFLVLAVLSVHYACSNSNILTLSVSFAISWVVFAGWAKFSLIFGKWLSTMVLSASPFNDPLKDKANMDKFVGQMWCLLIPITMTCCELRILWNQDWWYDTRSLWIPAPKNQIPDDCTSKFFIIQLGFWIFVTFSHRFLEKKHRDYYVYYAHHVVTIGLVYSAQASNYHRIGTLVLIVHDMANIPLSLMNIARLLGLRKKAGYFIAEGFTALNLIIWSFSRMYYYPKVVIWNSLFEM